MQLCAGELRLYGPSFFSLSLGCAMLWFVVLVFCRDFLGVWCCFGFFVNFFFCGLVWGFLFFLRFFPEPVKTASKMSC